MKVPTTLLALALVVVPATAVIAATAPAAPTAPVTVARYTFDGGVANGSIAEVSGRGVPLKVRAAAGGAVRLIARGTGRAVQLPALCRAGATACPRVVLEGADDVDLDPGTRPFRFGAALLATAAQVGPEANVMQKGVATTESQWKLQVGGKRGGRGQCVLVGRGSAKPYIARSDIAVADGRWHQVTCVRTATALAIWVDGRVRGTVAVPAALSVTNALPLRVGGRNLGASTDQFGGAIDDLFVALG